MSLTLNLWTFEPMKAAVGSPVPAAAAYTVGYEHNRALDFSPVTYSTIPSGTAWQVDIDLNNDSPTVDGIYLFIRNYAALANPVYLADYWSDNDVDYTLVPNSLLLTQSEMFSHPHRLRWYDPAGPTNPGRDHRYYRIAISVGTGDIPQIGMVAIVRRRELTRGFERPDLAGHRFFNRRRLVDGAVSHVTAARQNSAEFFPRKYKILGTTPLDVLRNAHLDSNGTLRPLILDERDSAAAIDHAALKLVRFSDDRFTPTGKDAAYFTPSIRFDEIPWALSGEAY